MIRKGQAYGSAAGAKIGVLHRFILGLFRGVDHLRRFSPRLKTCNTAFRTMSSIRAPALSFSANARSRTRHSIDSFHQPHLEGKGVHREVYYRQPGTSAPSAAGPCRRHRSPRFQGHGRAGNCLGPDSANDPSPPEESVADIRLCRAICLGLCTRRLGISGLNPQKLSITRHNPEG